MFQQRFVIDPGGRTVTGIMQQINRTQVMEAIATLRNESPPADREGLGRFALSIPFEDWVRLRTKYPELASTDAATKSRAYLRFLRSEESRPFRMR